MASILFAGTIQKKLQRRPRGAASGRLGLFLCQVSVAIVAGFRTGRLDRSLRRKRTDARSADGSKDPEKLTPDLEVGEKRDGETRTTEKEAQMTEGTPKATAGSQEKGSKEEQNSDDPPTPATAET